MKKYINLFLIAMCLCLAASCSKSGDELEKFIPQKSSWVAKINTSEILTKGKWLDQDGNISIPDKLKSSLDGNDTFAKRVIMSLPSSGLNFDSNIYLFCGLKSFSAEMLAQIDDAGKTEKWICQLTAESSMKQNGDYKYLLSKNSLYVIHGDVLFIGNSAKSDEKSLVDEVAKIFDNAGKSIADNKDAAEIINRDTDASIYVSMTEINSNGTLRPYIAKFPMLSMLSELDLKALAMTVDFDKEMKLNVEVKSDNNSGYSVLYSTMLAEPSADFLDVIPASMESVFSISLNGKQLLNISEFKKMLSSTATMPIIKDLDLERHISTINGPVAIAISKDADFVNEYNYVVVIASSNPNAILDDISRVAKHYGNQPQKAGNEYIFDYYNQKITIGIKDNRYIFFKVLNTQQNAENMAASKPVKDLLSKSKICFYQKSSTAVGPFELEIGSDSASKITASIRTGSNAENIITSIMSLICTAKPSSALDGFDEESAIEYGGFKPIDSLSGM